MTRRAPTGPFRLVHRTARELAASWCLHAPDGMVVTFREERRTDAQSRKMHAMAGDLSKQVPWCGQTLSVEDWKRFATAKLKKDKIIFDCDEFGQPSAAAGLVVIGARTREMSKAALAEVIEWFYWFGAQHGVQWSDEIDRAPEAIANAR